MVAQPAGMGKVLANKYRLESHLGEGGFGTIWRAHHLVLEAPVAVKLIDPDIASDEAATERFLREAKAAASLRSPHVVQILDYGVEEHQPFIVMELLEGENLAQRIKRVGRLEAPETVRIVTQVARAIGRAHEMGIVHRDLKPDNVFLIKNDDEEVAKVLDFGLAKVDATRLGHKAKGSVTRTGSLMGTPYYMSPEQAQGNKEVDFRSDLWSLGVMVFEALTGKRPFMSDGLGELVLQICVRPLPVPSEFAPVHPALDLWFAHACAREPEERYQSARELADSLREALHIESDETTITVADQEHPALRARATATPVEVGSAVRPGALREAARRLSQATTVRADAPGLRQSSSLHLDEVDEQTKPVGRGRVLGVAAVALVVGLGAGLVVLRSRSVTTPDVTPSIPGEKRSVLSDPGRWLASPRAAQAPAVSGERLPPETPSVEPNGVAHTAKAADTGSAKATGSANADWYGTQVDGGWVKPKWAQPEPDKPREEPPPPPPPADPDNPY
jgi:eukaryotic-like serine/threonine-protein kinase